MVDVSTFTDALNRLMAEQGVGVLALAREVPCDQGYISRLARGRQRPSIQIARRLDEVLNGNGQLTALASRRNDQPGADPDGVRETSASLITMERRLGGDAILPAAVQSFRTAMESAGDNHDRLAAAAEAGEVAGWVAYDAERPDVSRQLASEALTLSREAGDRDMELFLSSHLAMLNIEQGRPASAVRMSAAILDTRLPPRARAVFLIRRGRALVRLGSTRDGLADLTRARSLVGGRPGSRDPWWTFWADESEVAWQRGTALADLGQWRDAVPLLYDAAGTRAAGHGKRTVYHDRACLLESLVRARAWGDAVPVLGTVADSGKLIASARTTAVLRRAAAHTGNAPRDLADAVRDLAA